MTIGSIEINPQFLESADWRWGYALDIHSMRSVPLGYNAFGHMQYDTTRSAVGEMLYQLKYNNDESQVEQIAGIAAEFLQRTVLRKRAIHRLIPVPSSQKRQRQPVSLLANAIGACLGITVLEDAVRRIAPTPPAKNTDDSDQRREDQKNAFAIHPKLIVSGTTVLLFDDLYQTGSTAGAVARLLKGQGMVADVCFLAITRTRRSL